MGAINTQAGVILGLAAKASTEFGTSFGPVLALIVNAYSRCERLFEV